MSQGSENGEHAVVIGGSLAGLFAARVLSEHFDRVTILERDPVHDQPESRRGQPQTRHVHGLLAQGLHVIKKFFPGIEETLVEGGATVGDMGDTMRWYHFGDYKLQFESGLIGMLMSRPFLEWQIRRRVLSLPNVTLSAPCAARGLVATADRGRVTGVEVTRGDNGDDPETLAADLIVDACGRGSAAPRWLQGLGYERPPEEEVKVRVGYATRIYRRQPDDLVGAKLVMIFETPPAGKHISLLFPIEGDRWIVTAGGWAGDHPPDDEEGFLAFIRDMPASDVYDVVRRAEPLSDIVTHKFPSNLRRHYEKLKRFPAGFLVIGDAIGSFNPIYGQGMTSAAMQSAALAEVFGEKDRRAGAGGLGSPPDLWRPFFKQAAKVVDIAWQLAVGEDFRFLETEGPKPAGTDLINAYVGRVHHATHHDPVVYGQFLRVMNLMEPAPSLMRPRMAWRVLRRRPRA